MAVTPAKSSDDILDELFSLERYDPVLDVPLPSARDSELTCRQLIREAFTDNPMSTAEICFEVVDGLNRLKELLPERVDIETLLQWEENLLREGRHDPNILKKGILLLDPKSIARRAGLDVLIWANLLDDTIFQGNRDIWHSDFLAQYDHSTHRMRIAAAAMHQTLGRENNTSAAFKTYELGQVLISQAGLDSMTGNLTEFVRPGRELTPAELCRFGLEGLVISDGYLAYGKRHKYGVVPWDVGVGDVFHSFYLDAPLAIVMTYDGHPAAVFAALADGPQSLLVKQIQTITPRELTAEQPEIEHVDLDSNRWELEPVLWQRFLINSLAQIASPLGFSEIGIQSSVNNRWTKPDDKGEIHLPLERAERIYNRLAEALHMRRREDSNYGISLDAFLKA